MKKNLLFLSLVAFFLCNSAFAQNITLNPEATNESAKEVSEKNVFDKSEYFRLGLCSFATPDADSGLGLNSPSKINTMAKLPAAKMTTYVGDKISGLNVAFAKPVASNIIFFVRESMDGENLISTTLSSATAGWNEVLFSGDFLIENKDYYIGYTIPVLAGGSYAIGRGETFATEGALFLNVNDGNFTDYTAQFGGLTVQALISGDDQTHFENKSDLWGVTLSPNHPQNEVVDIPVRFNNIGKNAISEVEITYTYGTHAPVSQVLAANVPVGGLDFATVELSNITLDESGDFSVAITKINGVAHAGNIITKPVSTYNPDNTVPRKVLLEQFTTEQCVFCPQGAARLKTVLDKPEFQDKVIWVAHHAGFGTDQFTIPASQAYLRFYGGNTFAPAMMLDRTILSGSAPVMSISTNLTQIEGYFNQALDMLSFVSVNIAQNNPDVMGNRQVDITVSGEYKGDVPSEDLYVYIFLLENGITSNTQSGASGVYTHNHLIRSALNGTAGTKITWNGNNYSVNATGTLGNTWKPENMDVVAFVAKNYQNPINNAKVLNAEKATLALTTGIDDVYGGSLSVFAQDGAIVVHGEYTSIQVFGIDGKELNNNNLQKGVYLVLVKNNNAKTVKKVMVR